MVKRLGLFFLLAPALAAAGLSPTASALPALPSPSDLNPLSSSAQINAEALEASPAIPKSTLNHPGEDFLILTVISAPFTVLYSFVGATLIGWATQGNFPPDYSKGNLLNGAAIAAGTASLTIGLVSVKWKSGPQAKPSPVPSPTPGSAHGG